MPTPTLRSPRHEALRALLAERRKRAGLTQADVAARLGRYQSFVATVESGQRRVDVAELIDFADANRVQSREAIARLSATKRR